MVIPIDDRGSPVPDELVLNAQKGDSDCREHLLKAYQPYIVKITSFCCNRFVQEGVDEEISVALLAFNEAIDSYQPGHGSRFLSFARLVIERRLTDYFRRNKAIHMEIPFSGFGTGERENDIQTLERDAAQKAFIEAEAVRDRREEIAWFKKLLAEYEISLDELIRISPKHASARKRAVQAAQAIAGNEKWRDYFLKYRELPLKSLDGILPFSRKTLERQRKYIVALTLVFIEDLPHIKEYLKGGGGV